MVCLGQKMESSGKRPNTVEAVAVLGLTMLCMYSTVLPVFRQQLQAYLHLTIEQFGILVGIGMLAASAASLLCACFISRLGARWMLVAGLLSCAGGMAVVGCSGTFGGVMIGTSMMGAAALVVNIAGQAHLAEIFGGNARRVLSLQMAATSAAFVVWPLAAEALLGMVRRGTMTFAQALHWPYLAMGGCIAAGSLMLAGKRSAHHEARGLEPAGSAAVRLVRWPVGLLMAMAVLHSAPDSALYIWIPRVLASGSYPRVTISPGMVLSLFGLAYLVTRLIVGGLPSGLGNRAMLCFAGMVGGVLLVAAILTRNQAITGIGVVAGAAAWSIEYPALLAVLSAETGPGFGRALAIASVSGSLATFGLSAAMGWAAGALGETRLWMLLLLPASLFPMVSLGGIAYFRGKSRQLSVPELTTDN